MLFVFIDFSVHEQIPICTGLCWLLKIEYRAGVVSWIASNWDYLYSCLKMHNDGQNPMYICYIFYSDSSSHVQKIDIDYNRQDFDNWLRLVLGLD